MKNLNTEHFIIENRIEEIPLLIEKIERLAEERNGMPFDPTLQKEPATLLLVEERPLGGLGILLISKIRDTLMYSRDKNLKILTLAKHLK